MTRKRATNASARACHIELLSSDLAELVLEYSAPLDVARLAIASPVWSAHLVTYLPRASKWSSEMLEAVAVRLTPVPFIALLRGMSKHPELYDKHLNSVGLAASRCGLAVSSQCRHLHWTLDDIWAMLELFVISEVCSAGDASNLVYEVETLVWPLVEKGLATWPDVYKRALVSLSFKSEDNAADLLLNIFGTFDDEKHDLFDNESSLAHLVVQMELPATDLTRLVRRLQMYEQEDEAFDKAGVDMSLPLLEAWMKRGVWRCWAPDEQTVLEALLTPMLAQAFESALPFEPESFDRSFAYSLAKQLGGLAQIMSLAKLDSLLQRLTVFESHWVDHVLSYEAEDYDECGRSYPSNATSYSYSGLLLEAWAEATGYPQAAAPELHEAVTSLIANQSDIFQAAISRTVLSWIGLIVESGGDASLIAPLCASVAPRPPLYDVTQPELRGHAITVRWGDGMLRTCRVLGFTRGEGHAVTSLRVEVQKKGAADDEDGKTEFEVDAESDCWCWPGSESVSIAPPLRGVPQLQLEGRRVVVWTPAASLRPGMVRSYDCDDDGIVTSLCCALDAQSNEDAPETFTVLRRGGVAEAPWCWEEDEGSFLPLWGVAQPELISQRVYVKYGKKPVSGRITGFEQRKRGVDCRPCWEVATFWFAMDREKGKRLEVGRGDGSSVLVCATEDEWRWPGYEHELEESDGYDSEESEDP